MKASSNILKQALKLDKHQTHRKWRVIKLTLNEP